MKIVFLDAATLGAKCDLSSMSKLGDFKAYDASNTSEIKERIRDADIIISNKVKLSREHLAGLSHLKLIIAAATGMDHIDLAFCEEQNISVKNAVGYSTTSVVQHTFSMLFHLLHSNEYFQKYTRTGEWCHSNSFTHLDRNYFELAGKNWGIIGLGNIGSSVATIAKLFGANITYHSVSGREDGEYPHLDLEQLLKTSDIISIHTPLNTKTLNLLNKENLSSLKDDAIVINVGRGGIINEADLTEHFKKTNIKVGLDVLISEPMTKDSPLHSIIESERLFVTPHIAWASVESRQRLVDIIANHIRNL